MREKLQRERKVQRDERKEGTKDRKDGGIIEE